MNRHILRASMPCSSFGIVLLILLNRRLRYSVNEWASEEHLFNNKIASYVRRFPSRLKVVGMEPVKWLCCKSNNLR